MMMHHNDFEKLAFIAKTFLAVRIIIFSVKCGNAVYHLIRARYQ